MSAARVCVLGPSGRMGRAVIDAAAGRTDVRVAAAVSRRQEAPAAALAGVTLTRELRVGLAIADVYIDFTTPAATCAAATTARELRAPAVIGTTGLAAADEAAVDALAEVCAVVVAANFSLGVNLLLGLVSKAARALGPSWDAEIVETHHRAKRDAPSGTALALAQAIAAARGADYDAVHCHGRDGEVGARPLGQIGVHAVRGGDIVGEHTVSLFGAGERLELTHRATSRSIFAAGALHAAAWVVQQPPGRYDMLDVLGLR
ncbi:MAG: 4-hydroxy-tetrahydrodipicolinate reductase [Kofleriaceae bacterium]